MDNDKGDAIYRKMPSPIRKASLSHIPRHFEEKTCLVSVQNIITVKSPLIQEVNTHINCKLGRSITCCDCNKKDMEMTHNLNRKPISESLHKDELLDHNKQKEKGNMRLKDGKYFKYALESPCKTVSNTTQRPMGFISPPPSSPFKSPATPKVANLKVSSGNSLYSLKPVRDYEMIEKSSDLSCGNLSELLGGNAMALKQEVYNKNILSSELERLEASFEDDGMSCDYKRRRKSFDDIKSQVRKVTESKVIPLGLQPEKVRNDSKVCRINSMFCGIPKTKRLESIVKPTDSLISTILKIKDEDYSGSSLKNPFVLQEKTNSPMKKSFATREVLNLEPAGINHNLPNSKFFLKDLEFEEEKDESEGGGLNPDECIDSTPHQTVSKHYLKMKEMNTKANEGYTTVVTRRKAVIGLSNCPKSHFRRSARNRQVYFDSNGWVSVHNDKSNIKSIYIENTSKPSFEWNDEKSVVDIVKRVDLELEFDF